MSIGKLHPCAFAPEAGWLAQPRKQRLRTGRGRCAHLARPAPAHHQEPVHTIPLAVANKTTKDVKQLHIAIFIGKI